MGLIANQFVAQLFSGMIKKLREKKAQKEERWLPRPEAKKKP